MPGRGRKAQVALVRSLSAAQAAGRIEARRAYDESGLVIVDALCRCVSPDACSDRFRARALRPCAGNPTARGAARARADAPLSSTAQADADSLLGHAVATHLAHYVPSTERDAASAASRVGEVRAVVR